MKKKIKDLLFFIPLTILILIILLSAFFILPSMFKEAPSEQYIEYKDDVSDMLFYDADDIRQDSYLRTVGNVSKIYPFCRG